MNRHVTLVLALMLTISAGCSGSKPGPKSSGGSPVTGPGPSQASNTLIDSHNGLNDSERQEFYHLAEGSEVYPLDWLKVVESKMTGNRFLEDIERFGLIPDPMNRDGLPIGITAQETRDVRLAGKMIGVNCAACHVGQINYKGKSLRLDGAPNMFDARAFFTDIVESTRATVEDPTKLLAFLSRLAELHDQEEGESPSRLRLTVRNVIRRLDARESSPLRVSLLPKIERLLEKEADRPPIDLRRGLKVTDGDESERNEFRDQLLEDVRADIDGLVANVAEHNDALSEIIVTVRLLKARIEFVKRLGVLGQFSITEGGPGRVDAFGTARFLLFDSSYEPKAPVSYYVIWNFKQIPWLHYDGNTTSIIERNIGQALGLGAIYEPDTFASTILLENLDRMEELAGKITPPVWPAELFGKIDDAKYDKGSRVYATYCARCHPSFEEFQRDPDKLLFSMEEAGTDPGRAEGFAQKLPNGTDFYVALGDALFALKRRAIEDSGADPASHEFNVKGEFRATKKYAGRPLAAIWATAPFLHNGSVSSLDELLKPATQRIAKFPVGQREFDPVKLGYSTQATGPFVLDSTKTGNSNSGHDHATDLSPVEREALLEYLKGPKE